MSISSASVSLTDFTAYELPKKKWMRVVRPKMRLRVRVRDQNRSFLSSTVTVGDGSSDERLSSGVCWPWVNDDAQFAHPSFADDDVFEVEIERRFLLGYKCIRRTRPMTIDQVRTGNHCALSLYDGEQFGELFEDKLEIGEITFSLRSDVTSEETSEGSSIPTSE